MHKPRAQGRLGLAAEAQPQFPNPAGLQAEISSLVPLPVSCTASLLRQPAHCLSPQSRCPQHGLTGLLQLEPLMALDGGLPCGTPCRYAES